MTTDSRATESDADAHASRTVVRLRGEHDASTAARLSASMSWAIAFDNTDLVVDLGEVEFMDASTARVLIRTRTLLSQRSRSLVLRAPPECALRVIELAGLGDLIEGSRREPLPDSRSAAAGPRGDQPTDALTSKSRGAQDRASAETRGAASAIVRHLAQTRTGHPAGRGGP